MSYICIGIGLIIILFVIIFVIRSRQIRREQDSDNHIEVPPIVNCIPRVINGGNRVFTIAELKQAEEGKYNWDDAGNVFEINPDGSVTIVGHFDPTELQVDPIQEMFERLNDEGFIEMLPRIWSFHVVNNNGGENDTFVVAWNNDILSVPTCPHTIDGIKEVSLMQSSFDGGKSVITFILSKIGDGYLILMPSYEKEYILSLGAKACVERAFDNKVRVIISSPSVMGAFGIAIACASNKLSRISFAFGEGEDYMCCDLIANEGVCEVQKLLRNSIIQPTNSFIGLKYIAKGCMAQSLIREGRITNFRLIDMLPFTMSLLLKENGQVVKIYDCICEPISIPTKQGDKDINVDNKSLSFLIGSYELIEDVISECNVLNGRIDAFIELDSEMSVMIKISSDTNDYKINVGELIG